MNTYHRKLHFPRQQITGCFVPPSIYINYTKSL